MRQDRRYRPFSLVLLLFAAAVAATMPSWVAAIENYQGQVTAGCHRYGSGWYNVKAVIADGAPNWKVTGLQYQFDPNPVQLQTIDDGTRTRYFAVSPPGSYTVTVGNPALQRSYNVTVGPCPAPAPTASRADAQAAFAANPLHNLNGRAMRADEPLAATRTLADGRVLAYRKTAADVALLVEGLREDGVTAADLLDPNGWLTSNCAMTLGGACAGNCAGKKCSYVRSGTETFKTAPLTISKRAALGYCSCK